MEAIMSISLHKSNVTGKYYLRFYENYGEDYGSSDTPIEVTALDKYIVKLLDKLELNSQKKIKD